MGAQVWSSGQLKSKAEDQTWAPNFGCHVDCLPPVAQVSAMLLCAYGTYLVCEVVDQSGIVGALVCGFGMKK